MPTGSAVDKVKALQAYYFYYNEAGNLQGFDRPEDVGPAPRHLGLIAQELQAVEPSLVRPMTWLGDDAAGEGQGDYDGDDDGVGDAKGDGHDDRASDVDGNGDDGRG